jgi:hypothetical protein
MTDNAQQDNKKDNAAPSFKVTVNDVSFTTHAHDLTGGQIKELAGIPADYELFHVQGEQTIPVGTEEVVHIHNNDHFRAIPAGTFGRNDLAT